MRLVQRWRNRLAGLFEADAAKRVLRKVAVESGAVTRIALLVLGLGLPTLAQEPGDRVKLFLEMGQVVKVTDDQKAKITEILQTMPPSAERFKAMLKVLTPAQRKQAIAFILAHQKKLETPSATASPAPAENAGDK